MKRCLPLLVALVACSHPVEHGSTSLAIAPKAVEAQVGGEAVAFTATLQGTSDDVVWTLVPEVGTLSNATGLTTNYTPPASAAPTTVVLIASAGELSAFASISLVAASDSRPTLHVHPQLGVDTADGSVNAPLKTIRRALTLAEPDSTVYLAGGDYSEASGETYLEVTDGASGYLVPEGVEVSADPNDHAQPVVIRNDAAARDAFRFVGDGRLSGVRLEGFKRGLSSTTGTQLVESVTMLNIAEVGVAIEGDASVFCTHCHISVAYGVAFELDGSARLTVDGASSINTRSPAHEPLVVAIHLKVGSEAEALLELAGGISRGSHVVSGGRLTLQDVDVRLRSTQTDTVLVDHEAELAMFDGAVSGGHFFDGSSFMPACMSLGTLSINGTVFENNPGGSLELSGGSADIRNAVFQDIGVPEVVFAGSGVNAIVVKNEAELKMRGTQIRNVKEAGNYNPPTPGTQGTGLYIADASGGIDLGTEAEPGRNHFHDCGLTGVNVGQSAGDRTVQAVGNTWTPDKQGADEKGRYAAQLVTQGDWGVNFRVNDTSAIQF